MLLPPTNQFLTLHEPAATRPVYDIPTVVGSPQRRRRLRGLATRLTRQARYGASRNGGYSSVTSMNA